MSEVISVQVPTTVAEAMVMQDVAAAYLREHAPFNDRVGFAEAALQSQARRVEELEGALRPFAKAAGTMFFRVQPDDMLVGFRAEPEGRERGYTTLPTVADYRAARSALQSRDTQPPSAVTAPDAELGLGKEKS